MKTYNLENPTDRRNFYEAQRRSAEAIFNAAPDAWMNFSFELVEANIDQAATAWEEQNIVDDLEEARAQMQDAMLDVWEDWRVEKLLDEAYKAYTGDEISISIGDEWRDGDIVVEPEDVQIIVLGECEFAFRLRTYSTDTEWELGDADDVLYFAYSVANETLFEKNNPQ